jgi:hypothetical protein
VVTTALMRHSAAALASIEDLRLSDFCDIIAEAAPNVFGIEI